MSDDTEKMERNLWERNQRVCEALVIDGDVINFSGPLQRMNCMPKRQL